MDNDSQYTQEEQESNDLLKVKEFISACREHWQWFVVCVIIMICIATLHLLRTPNVYVRSASIVIKEDTKGKGNFSSQMSNLSDLGMFSSTSDVNNELYAIQSPSLMVEVAKRLGLNIGYYADGAFHKETLYGRNQPVVVTFASLPDRVGASFKLVIYKNETIEVSDVRRKGERQDGKFHGRLSQPMSTPLGKITVTPTANFKKPKERQVLYITHQSLLSAGIACSRNMKVAMRDKKAAVIDLSYSDVSTQRAEDIINTLIKVYNESWVQDKNQVAVATSHFIDERLQVIESELGNVDNSISSYKSANLIPDLEAASKMYMQQANQSNTAVMELNNQLQMARYVRAQVSKDGTNQLLPVNSGIGSNSVETQIGEYNKLILERNKLVANSGTNNPIVADMDQQIKSTKRAIVSSIDNQVSSLQEQIRGFRGNEAQSNARIASNPTQAKHLLSAERQQKVKEALYLFLLQKREENELSQAFTAYNTRIITPPMGSLVPVSPSRNKIYLIAIALGLAIPACLVLLLQSMNTTVRGRKDVENIGVPFLGEIPMAGKVRERGLKGFIHRVLGIQPNPAEQAMTSEAKLVVKPRNRNTINEAFRLVRTNLEFMINRLKKVVMVTSINAGSGKTFITMNLASSMAIQGKRVCVVDLDIRKASLSRYVGSPHTGVTAWLSNQADNWEDLIVHPTQNPDLDVIPAGVIPPNPTELLYSNKLEELLNNLHRKYDVIFLDCPPIEIVADASIVAKSADDTLLVIRAGLMQRDMLPAITSLYKEQRLPNMAFLLNGTSINNSQYGYSYGYGYGYGNSYGYYNDEDEEDAD